MGIFFPSAKFDVQHVLVFQILPDKNLRLLLFPGIKVQPAVKRAAAGRCVFEQISPQTLDEAANVVVLASFRGETCVAGKHLDYSRS